MLQSSVKFGINNLFNDIRFNEEYYTVYNNILNDRNILTYELFIFFILQISLKTKFHGYFDELYVDIIKRKFVYIKELINNFKVSYIGKETLYNKIYKKIFKCNKMSKKEIYFYRRMREFDFDSVFSDYFVLNNNNKQIFFINTCQQIYEAKIRIKKENQDKSGSSKVVCI